MNTADNESKLESLSNRLRIACEKAEVEQARMAKKLGMSDEDLEKLRQSLKS